MVNFRGHPKIFSFLQFSQNIEYTYFSKSVTLRYANIIPSRKASRMRNIWKFLAEESGTWLLCGSYGVYMAVMGST